MKIFLLLVLPGCPRWRTANGVVA